jgi:hypothetical protein
MTLSPQHKEKQRRNETKYQHTYTIPLNNPYHNSHAKCRRQDREDRCKQQIIRYGDVVDSEKFDFEQPSDKYEQGKVLSKERHTAIDVDTG